MTDLEADTGSAKKVAELRGAYLEINGFDLMIAGICISHGASITSQDPDFGNIDELEAEELKK